MMDDWTEAERAGLAALPRAREASRLLEERTVAALKESGLLGGRRRGRPAAGWWVAGAAAALACFLGGLSVGQSLGARQTGEIVAQLRTSDTERAAAIVQQAGSTYIAALAGFGVVAERAPTGAAEVGREVALNAFWAAADEVARIAPDDPHIALIVQARQAAIRAAERADEPRRVVWF